MSRKQTQLSDCSDIQPVANRATQWGLTYVTPGLGNRHYKSDQYEQEVWYTNGVIDQRMRTCNIHLQNDIHWNKTIICTQIKENKTQHHVKRQ